MIISIIITLYYIYRGLTWYVLCAGKSNYFHARIGFVFQHGFVHFGEGYEGFAILIPFDSLI